MTDRLRDDVRGALLGVKDLSGGCEARYRFSANLPLFAGHFPGDPVLPGVHQVEMVRTALDSIRGVRHRIGQLRSAKFKRRVSPGEEVLVHVVCSESDGKFDVKAILAVDGQEASLISLVIHEESHCS